MLPLLEKVFFFVIIYDKLVISGGITLKDYVELVLKKEKKAISLEKICSKIEKLIIKENSAFEGLSEFQKNEVAKILEAGVSNYKYYKTPADNYCSIYKTSFRKGRFHGNKRGDGKVTVLLDNEVTKRNHIVNAIDYEITKDNVGSAIDGDLVLIDLGFKNVKPKIVDILDRNLENIMGEVYCIGKSYFVRPIDKKKQNLTIALEGEAIEGQRVAVELEQHTAENFYLGKITRTFNHKDDPDEDILWEAFKCGIDDQFSKESIEQVKSIPKSVREVDKIGRSDLTNWEIFTIDGEDTKDIDDALSCELLENGNYKVGVHIADVSYYVPKGSALDKDAFKRGTSNYLAGTVIPMLMRELSNGICSLNPEVERLAMSCIMEVDPNGKIVKYDILPTVIKSQIKMTYTKVNNILKDGEIDPEYIDHADTLRNLNKLALILRKNRLLAGAVEFDRPEMKLIFGADGRVEDFGFRIQDVGENLIEEFMLLANETVDKHLSRLGLPCLHRVHSTPNLERLTDYFKLLDAVNLPFNKYTAVDCAENPKALQELAEFVKDSGKLSSVLSTNLIRCMSRAKYSPENIGHCGLAKDYYCHFTSPIRRYPDLTVHRIIKDCYFDKENSRRNAKKWESELVEIGQHSSKMERIADAAEINTLNMRCSEYMENHIGERYEGMIIGISHYGVQIQLDNMIEGRVRYKDMPGDYVYNSETYTLVSMDGHSNYFIGDRLVVEVVSASKEAKKIDFKIISKINENYINDSSDSNNYVKMLAKKQRANREFYNI